MNKTIVVGILACLAGPIQAAPQVDPTRPPATIQEQAAGQPQDRGLPRVSAIFVGQDRSYVLVEDKILHPGEFWGAWQLFSIRNDAATFGDGVRQVEVRVLTTGSLKKGNFDGL